MLGTGCLNVIGGMDACIDPVPGVRITLERFAQMHGGGIFGEKVSPLEIIELQSKGGIALTQSLAQDIQLPLELIVADPVARGSDAIGIESFHFLGYQVWTNRIGDLRHGSADEANITLHASVHGVPVIANALSGIERICASQLNLKHGKLRRMLRQRMLI